MINRIRSAIIALTAFLCLSAFSQTFASAPDPRQNYALELLNKAQLADMVALKTDSNLPGTEAFRITKDSDKVTITGGGPAGLLYGTQQYANHRDDFTFDAIDKPDFEVRGTTLFLMKDCSYDFELKPQEFPWFYDRPLITRFLDYLLENRFNTIFLWTGHLFPSIVEMPEYPDATSLTKEELLRNQEQFKWFTSQCAKRNISVLLHFYNIHISAPLAHSRNIPMHYNQPNEFVTKYVGYSLRRFLDEFDSVGLYVCPGEQLKAEYTPQWIRDVIFKAAKDSGKHPRIVIRDWGLDAEKFKKVCANEYDNYYTELKHNVEMIVSPVPDERHAFWEGVGQKHIVNLHEAADVKPFRWGSPRFISEMVREWKKAGIDGAEVYGMASWRWPYSLDKLEPNQTTYWPRGPKLVTFDRDAIWLEAFGRYLWKIDRNPAAENSYWSNRLAQKFASPETGKLLVQWYDTTGPILPGLQNLTSVRNMNLFPTAVGAEQYVDSILAARTIKENNRMGANYLSRPVDTYFFEQYKTKYKMPWLTNRISMPVSVYADKLAAHQDVNDAMTPDKITGLLVELAEESVQLAEKAQSSAVSNKDEARRFVTDSQALVYIAQAWRHKVMATIEKKLWLTTDDDKHKDAFVRHMEDSVTVYKKLVELTDKTYLHATDLSMKDGWLGWHSGLRNFKADVNSQKEFIFIHDSKKNSDFFFTETEDMEGNWNFRNDYPGFSGNSFRTSDGLQDRTTALRKQFDIKTAGTYSVWVRGFIIKSGNDCGIAVEVAGKKFPSTHNEPGPEKGKYVWHKAGQVDLAPGPAEVLVRDGGTGFDCPDALALTKDPNWTPPNYD